MTDRYAVTALCTYFINYNTKSDHKNKQYHSYQITDSALRHTF